MCQKSVRFLVFASRCFTATTTRPHFHAAYADHKALIDIQGGYVIRGALPSRQLKLILAWCELHRDELMQNWELSKDARSLNHIAPLA